MAAAVPRRPDPDAKDWTWVLERACPECGFDAAGFDVATTAEAIRSNAQRWADVLVGADVAVRSSPGRWSPLEYACHVRDVMVIYRTRLDRMLDEDGPHYDNWDQDATAIEQRYDLADPAVVVAEVSAAADALAARFATVEDADWARTGFRSDGAAFTVDSFARYFIHDPIHHLWDVGADSD